MKLNVNIKKSYVLFIYLSITIYLYINLTNYLLYLVAPSTLVLEGSISPSNTCTKFAPHLSRLGPTWKLENCSSMSSPDGT